jgi:hypothetical protein
MKMAISPLIIKPRIGTVGDGINCETDNGSSLKQGVGGELDRILLL